MCRGFCKETQKAPPNYSAVVLSVESVEKTQVRLILVALSKQTRSSRSASFQAL
jgi:hypothetical protein